MGAHAKIQFCVRIVVVMVLLIESPLPCAAADGPPVPEVPHRFWLVQLSAPNCSNSVDAAVACDGLEQRAAASAVADRYGCRVARTINGFDNTYMFELLPLDATARSQKRSHKLLPLDAHVNWVDEQRPLRRSKRDDTRTRLHQLLKTLNPFRLTEILRQEERLLMQKTFQNNRFNPDDPIGVEELVGDSLDSVEEEAFTGDTFDAWFTDELWPQQWYLQAKRFPFKLDLNVLAVYAKGITGRGVRVAVLDDGLEYQHEDLAPNYDSSISWDINHDRPDPTPDHPIQFSSHGTRCAGEIAMAANNGKCGVGVAFNAYIGGIKMLGGQVYDAIEGMALQHAIDRVDVYSASWGPLDNGQTLDRPGRLVQLALERGVRIGRGGRGAIYVWASGNGRASGDNCNCDGYAASRMTITIGSASQRGSLPWYGERCTAVMAVTYSSGSERDPMIATTDVANKCTVRHTGTSAAAPLAAGIVALTLEANPALGWRDVQHLIVRTANRSPLAANPGWTHNAAGLHYHTGLGFGLMDADAMVTMAMTGWLNVPPAEVDHLTKDQLVRLHSTGGRAVRIRFGYTGDIVATEHVEVTINVEYPMRGAIAVYLTSPGGTKVPLLSPRRLDNSPHGFKNWTLMSVATWSEDPRGAWRLDIVDEGPRGLKRSGHVGKCVLTVHGTTELPDYRRPEATDTNDI